MCFQEANIGDGSLRQGDYIYFYSLLSNLIFLRLYIYCFVKDIHK